MFSKHTMSLALALLLTTSAFAQDNQKAEEAKTGESLAASSYNYLKSHFSASYHGEYSFTRKDISSTNEADHDIQDLKIMHNPTVVYRPSANLKLLVTSEFKYTDAAAKGTFVNRYYRSLVLLTRENVLTEKDNGIKLDFTLGRRLNDRNHGTAKSYGNNRVNVSMSKKFGEKLSTSLLAQYLSNDPVHSQVDASTWRHSFEFIPSFTWQITDKISYFFNDDIIISSAYISNDHQNIEISHEMNIGVVTYQFNDQNSAYFQLKYVHASANNFAIAQNTIDTFDYYIGHTYTFNPKLSLTSEMGSNLVSSRDGRDFLANAAKYPEFALYLDYSL